MKIITIFTNIIHKGVKLIKPLIPIILLLFVLCMVLKLINVKYKLHENFISHKQKIFESNKFQQITLPNIKNYDIELSIPAGQVLHSTVQGNWGISTDANNEGMTLGVYRDGYSADGSIFKGKSGKVYKRMLEQGPYVLKYEIRDGKDVKISVNGKLIHNIKDEAVPSGKLKVVGTNYHNYNKIAKGTDRGRREIDYIKFIPKEMKEGFVGTRKNRWHDTEEFVGTRKNWWHDTEGMENIANEKVLNKLSELNIDSDQIKNAIKTVKENPEMVKEIGAAVMETMGSKDNTKFDAIKNLLSVMGNDSLSKLPSMTSLQEGMKNKPCIGSYIQNEPYDYQTPKIQLNQPQQLPNKELCPADTFTWNNKYNAYLNSTGSITQQTKKLIESRGNKLYCCPSGQSEKDCVTDRKFLAEFDRYNDHRLTLFDTDKPNCCDNGDPFVLNNKKYCRKLKKFNRYKRQEIDNTIKTKIDNYNKDIVKRERERTNALFIPLRLQHDNSILNLKKDADKEINRIDTEKKLLSKSTDDNIALMRNAQKRMQLENKQAVGDIVTDLQKQYGLKLKAAETERKRKAAQIQSQLKNSILTPKYIKPYYTQVPKIQNTTITPSALSKQQEAQLIKSANLAFSTHFQTNKTIMKDDFMAISNKYKPGHITKLKEQKFIAFINTLFKKKPQATKEDVEMILGSPLTGKTLAQIKGQVVSANQQKALLVKPSRNPNCIGRDPTFKQLNQPYHFTDLQKPGCCDGLNPFTHNGTKYCRPYNDPTKNVGQFSQDVKTAIGKMGKETLTNYSFIR